MQAPKSAAASIPPMKDTVLVLHCSMIHSFTNIAEAIDAINMPPRANAMRRAVFSTLSKRALVLSLFIYAPIAVCIPECSAPSFSILTESPSLMSLALSTNVARPRSFMDS